MPPIKSSGVWKYFIGESASTIRYKLCSIVLKNCGNTTNMNNHLKRKHSIDNKTTKFFEPDLHLNVDDPDSPQCTSQSGAGVSIASGSRTLLNFICVENTKSGLTHKASKEGVDALIRNTFGVVEMLSRREALQLGALLLCVPMQYLLVVSVPSALECTHAVLQAVSALRGLRSSLLRWLTPPTAVEVDGTDSQESPAIEVLQLRERAGYWASSPEPRLHRPTHLAYRVGQVVRHRILGFRAAIVGWDLHAKAPETWLRNHHGENQDKRSSPHYLVLVDQRDRAPASPVYVPQDQLENYSGIRIHHPDMGKYFDYYDGAQYLPKEKLKTLYPKD